MQRFPVLLGLLAALAGCASEGGKKAGGEACTDPRPQVCTMIYAPVCATLEHDEQRTYSSDCNACADIAVIAHVDGACPE